MILPQFGDASLKTTPFPHVLLPEIIPRSSADKILEWLREDAPWTLRVESFYEQHEISLEQSSVPDCISTFVSEDFIGAVAERLALLFGERDGLILADISAHRLSGGQTIRVHNDYIGEAESHRLLIQLNDGWSVERGGLLMLFSSSDPRDVSEVIMPIHGSGFAFEISPKSHHAVSSTRNGERFTIVYTFRRVKRLNSSISRGGLP